MVPVQPTCLFGLSVGGRKPEFPQPREALENERTALRKIRDAANIDSSSSMATDQYKLIFEIESQNYCVIEQLTGQGAGQGV